ncbi:MAG TPA: SLC13 family permease [bacterium]|nr:SLC13 family permease [bacterium]
MNLSIAIVFVLIILAVILFTSEVISFDLTALIIAGSLMASGILTVKEGLSGFSNQATITIGAMFILSEGLRQTGVLRAVGSVLTFLGKQSFWVAAIAIMIITAGVSAFINNTAAVAIFIPVIIGVAKNLGTSPSKLLIPLSFASISGGVCTLIGTSTNILVNSIAADRGVETFSMFDFFPLGIILLVTVLLYLIIYGIRKLPAYFEEEEDLTAQFDMDDHISDVKLDNGYLNIGEKIKESKLTKGLDLDILRIFKKDTSESAQRSQSDLEKGDVLRVRGNADEIEKMQDSGHLSMEPPRDWEDNDLIKGRDTLLEVSLSPNSTWTGKNIGELNFQERFDATVLAIRHQGQCIRDDMDQIDLIEGDSLLLSVNEEHVPTIIRDPNFLIVSKKELPKYKTEKIVIALSILLGVVLTATFNLIPIVVGAMIGSILMIITGCLDTEQAYESINWKVIFLLAGVLPLGIALDKTGAAQMISDFLVSILEPFGPKAVLSGFFLFTMLMTNVVSKQAAAALFAPIAVHAANSIGASPRPFLLAVAYAASLSFITPVGHQVNTMVYNPGRYKFTDFVKIGTPLSIIVWIVVSLLLPFLWNF